MLLILLIVDVWGRRRLLGIPEMGEGRRRRDCWVGRDRPIGFVPVRRNANVTCPGSCCASGSERGQGMGKRVNSPLLRYLGWATFVVMTAAAVGIDPYISNSDRPPFSGCVANKGLTRSYWPM